MEIYSQSKLTTLKNPTKHLQSQLTVRAFPSCRIKRSFLLSSYRPNWSKERFRLKPELQANGMKTQLLLADDHPPLVEAALAILKPHYDVVGVATDGAMLVSEALRLSPEVIV